jgi:hypothetical protein
VFDVPGEVLDKTAEVAVDVQVREVEVAVVEMNHFVELGFGVIVAVVVVLDCSETVLFGKRKRASYLWIDGGWRMYLFGVTELEVIMDRNIWSW